MAKQETTDKPKHAGGRPPKYETPEEFQKKVDEYFETGVATRPIKTGVGVKQKTTIIKKPTITGLVLFLGFCDRQSFYAYGKKGEFSHTIKGAATRIAQEYEENLTDGGNAGGSIFALKNLGWSDRSEVQHDISDDMADLIREVGSRGVGLPIKESE